MAPDRAYLAFDRLEALAVRTGAPDRFTQLCRRLIDENPQDWRARLALSRHLAGERPAARRARPAVRGARPEPARARHPPGDLARARPAAPSEPSLVERYSELTAPRGLLPRPARLHALPLPQHGAALAVPALPRLEHVRRGADRARAGRRRKSRSKGNCRLQTADCSLIFRSRTRGASGSRPPARRSPRTCRRS